MLESVVLLAVNAVGLLLTGMAWRVSDQDVRVSSRWEPDTSDPEEYLRRRHNRRVITSDARYGEIRRLYAHAAIAVIALIWVLVPQPTNPHITWWAVAIRGSLVLVSLILIDKTIHHLIARYRFDRPDITTNRLPDLWPALAMAWRDMRVCSRSD